MPVASGCMVKSRKLVIDSAGNHINALPRTLTAHLSSLLQDCIKRADIHAGRCVHDRILRNSSELQSPLKNQLIRLYTICGCLPDANHVFCGISNPNVHAWSAIIFANAKLGRSVYAIELYYKMQEMHVETDNHVLVATLRACTDDVSLFRHGKLLHHHAVELDSDSDAYIASSLIGFYTKNGALDDSYRVFSRQKDPDSVTWGIMIGAFTQHGHAQQALYLYKRMQEVGMDIDEVIFLCALKACCNVKDSEHVRFLHTHIVGYGLEIVRSLGNALVDAYAKCGTIEEARNVFIALPRRDVVTWSTIIEGYVQHGSHEDALSLFQEMHVDNIDPDRVVAISCLKACSYSGVSYDGKLMHSYVLMRNLESDRQLSCVIVDMHAKCGSIEDAFATFQMISHHDVVTFNTMMSAFLQHGHPEEAAYLFQQMLQQHIIPNEVTFVCILKVCSAIIELCLGRIIHTYIIESIPELGSLVINTLIDMFSKCGSLDDALHVFNRSPKQDVVAWVVLISGFVQHGRCEEGCKYFWQMLGERPEAEEAAFLGGLKACIGVGDLALGRLVHAQITKRNSEHGILVGNTLIDFYGKCGSFEDAWAVFANLKKRDNITYNAMIAACAQYNQSQKSLFLFGEMVVGGILPNQVTFACTISACTDIVAIDYGKLIHNLFVEMALDDDLYITNALVGMYGKCGSPESALKIFNESSKKDIITWNAIIAGCVQHSSYDVARSYFEQMHKVGVQPDGVTFLSLLSACAHVGLVEEGCHLFKSMKRDFRLTPSSDHYSCMLDLFGRAGFMTEAADFWDITPCKASSEGQTSLLSHCKEKGIVELGHLCFDHLANMGGINAVDCMHMWDTYLNAARANNKSSSEVGHDIQKS